MQHPELLMHRGRPEGPFVRPSPVGPRLPRLAAGATAGQACPRLAWSDLPMSYQDHVGKTETATDTVWPLLIRGLADDGHPRRGGFMPPVHDLPRRMWAGGRVRFLAPLYAGQQVTRVNTILKIEEKSGASGRLVFVTVGQRISGPDGLAIEEEQDIVYRSAEGAAVKPADPAPSPPAGPAARTVSRVVDPNTVLLFRYSA